MPAPVRDLTTLAIVALVLAGLAADARAQPAPEPIAAEVKEPAPRDLVVEIDGVEAAALLDELRLRLPGRSIVGHRDARPAAPFDYAVVRVDSEGAQHLTLVQPTGDAFDRTLPAEPDESVRVIASSLALLVDSVESEALAPTRRDVEIPPPPVEAAEPAPAPAPAPAPVPQPARPVVETPPSAPAPPPRLEAGPFVAIAPVLGVAPTSSAPVLAAAGGEAGVRLRSRRGVLGVFGVRAVGRTARDLVLVRMRVAAGAGYALRRGAFELPIEAALTIEPWWLRRDGASAPLLRGTQDGRRVPLLGGLVRVAPGVFVPIGRSETALRVGAWLELAGSFAPDAGARTVEVGVEGSTGAHVPALRLGGLELATGLEVGVWLPALR